MNKNNVLFVTFYGLIDYIEEISDNLSGYYNIFDIQFVKLLNDDNNSISYIIEKTTDVIISNNIKFLFLFVLPDDEIFYVKIKEKCKNIIFLFYNFEGSNTFNSKLVKLSRYIDIFLDSNEYDNDKYSIIMNKKIYSFPKYINFDLFDTNIINIEQNHNKYITIIVDHFDLYDLTEINQLTIAINNITHICIKHNYNIKLFGNNTLEKYYPDIYVCEIEYLFEYCVYIDSILIFILDFYFNLKKQNNIFILHVLLFNHINEYKVKFLCNSNILNDIYKTSQYNILFDPFDTNNIEHNISHINNITDISDISAYYIMDINDWIKQIINIIDNYNEL